MKIAIILGSGPSGQAYQKQDGHAVLGSNDAYFLYPPGMVDCIFVHDNLARITAQRPRTLETPPHIPVIGCACAGDIPRVDIFYKTRAYNTYTKESLLKLHGSVTPHFAALWALANGFARLEVWGVDLTGYELGHVRKIMGQFGEIAKLAKSMGAEMAWASQSPMFNKFNELI